MTSQIRLDLLLLQSEFHPLSQPVEVSSPLGPSELVNSSTRPNPLSLTLISVQLLLFVICVLEVSKTEPHLELGACHFAAKNVRNNLSTHGLKYPLLAKRMACMVISGAATADSLDILQPCILSPEMILQMEKEFILLRSALEETHITDEHMTFLTKQWYVGVLARIRVNAFGIALSVGLYEDLLSSSAVGNAVYMLPSFYNHDCDPNAHIAWIENSDARMKAIRDIEAGEELSICYIDGSIDHDARQTLLSGGFGFKCCCLRCLSGD